MAFSFHCNDMRIQMAREKNHGNDLVTEMMTSTWWNRIQWYHYFCWATSSGGMRELFLFSSVTVTLQETPVFSSRTAEKVQNVSHSWCGLFFFSVAMKKVQRNSKNILLLQNCNLHGTQCHSAKEKLAGRAATFSATD